MKPVTFSPEIESAIAQDHKLHERGECDPDCGFCLDLILSGLPSAPAELKRIHQLRYARQLKRTTKQKPATPPIAPTKRVGKGTGAPLANKLKKSSRA